MPTCPVCQSPLRPYGRGATARKRPDRWVCPVAEAEQVRDSRGWRTLVAGAKHRDVQFWRGDDPRITEETC